jgi:superfamily II DNA or RNA helicase
MPQMLEDLGDTIPRRIRDRGDAYFRSGRVHIGYGDASEVVAEVHGSQKYGVLLLRKGPAIETSCTCPFAHTEICKHIWATLRAASSTGLLQGRDGRPPEWLELTINDESAEPDESPSRAALPQPRLRIVPRSYRPKGLTEARTGSQKSDWQNLLDHLDRLEASDPVPRPPTTGPVPQILYLLDFEASYNRRALSLTLLRRHRKASGEWSQPKPCHFTSREIEALPDPDDRRIFSLLLGASDARPSWRNPIYAGAVSSTCVLASGSVDTMLPMLCRTGRFLGAVPEGDAAPIRPLEWEDQPWEFGVRLVPSEKDYSLEGILRRGDECIELTEPSFLHAGTCLLIKNRLSPLEDHGAFQWLVELRRGGSLTIGKAEIEQFLERYHNTLSRTPLETPPELAIQTVAGTPRPLLRVKRPAWTRGPRAAQLVAHLEFDYAGKTVSFLPFQPEVFDAAARRLILRDSAAERTSFERLVELGFQRMRPVMRDMAPFTLAAAKLPEAARVLMAEGWRVEAEGQLVRSSGAINVRVTSGVDWFELEGGIDYGGATVSLPSLLSALRKHEKWVRLDDGSLGLLPEQWLDRLNELARLGTVDKDELRFHRSQIGFLDLLLAEIPGVEADQVFARARGAFRTFEGVTPRSAPVSFRGTLREYQKDGLGWFDFLEQFGFGGCLADDMGLGKTVQVLALLAARNAGQAEAKKPSLVVAPRSLVFNWLDETARFTPHLRWRDHTGHARRQDARAFSECDVVITTYGTLRRDVRLFAGASFDVIILDEAQSIKNANTQSSKAVRLLKGHRRLALSGTPIENHLGEVWSLFEFLNPGMLGTAPAFRQALKQRGSPDSRTVDTLSRALRPFILRRTKQQVARELPDRTEQTLHCEMKGEQKRLYEELRDYYRAALTSRIAEHGVERSQIQILEGLLRLRQAACHPGLIDRARVGDSSAKLEALLPHLEEILAEGHKALVFSQFTSFLAIVRRRLDAMHTTYAYLDGRTRNRAEAVERFQTDPSCPLFLISLKAGGLGLNLTAAEYVYLLDPWWNPAVEAQAIDRTHRIGQTRPVFAYRLVARGTVEERILEIQAGKRELVESILRADGRLSGRITREDLELLLS